VVAGLLLLFNTQLGLGGGEVLRNPIPPAKESLEAGATTYAQVCQTCHGDAGRGDGPAAAGLLPLPADLVVHVPLHGDADLFRFIRDGIPNTAMAPQGDRLTEEQIWNVVNYIRTIEE
jgi:mono/diheme cytochrome c family protein